MCTVLNFSTSRCNSTDPPGACPSSPARSAERGRRNLAALCRPGGVRRRRCGECPHHRGPDSRHSVTPSSRATLTSASSGRPSRKRFFAAPPTCICAQGLRSRRSAGAPGRKLCRSQALSGRPSRELDRRGPCLRMASFGEPVGSVRRHRARLWQAELQQLSGRFRGAGPHGHVSIAVQASKLVFGCGMLVSAALLFHFAWDSSLLVAACMGGHTFLVKQMLEAGVSPRSPSISIVKRPLGSLIRSSAENRFSPTPLDPAQAACFGGHAETQVCCDCSRAASAWC
jgi:hypothetical protein